jgi:hypothetical protein
MSKAFFFLLVFLCLGCNGTIQEEFLGRTREEVLESILRSKNEFKDTLIRNSASQLIEQILINKIRKWNTDAEEIISIDSSNRVVSIHYFFATLPTSENKSYGMKSENKERALEDLSKKYGKAELIKQDYYITYHWEDSLNIYEFFGLEGSNSNNICNFAGETKKYRDYRRTLQRPTFLKFSDSLLRIAPGSLLKKMDSIRLKIANFPFAK